MSTRSTFALAAVLALFTSTALSAQDHSTPNTPIPKLSRVWQGTPPLDPRLSSVRTLYQGSGFKPYTDKDRWLARAAYLRQQVLIAAGLWPLPEKCDLNPTVHSPIDRGDYTVEKVFFQSHPGFYVTGNLYRPKGKPGPFPAVLCPHGHWANGRFYQAPDREVEQQLKDGLETNPNAARYPLQARCANLAKLGCIVFHYDMIGYADADPERFPHRNTFRDIQSDLYAINMLGLQTWNSIRALDFLLSRPDVDPTRIACTGASGGGTQTFILMAVDDRLAAAAPVCMISSGDHQGGCVCENASLLRLFTDNVEFAATFAPKPFVHPTATGDWTRHFMEQGLPEIKAIYKLFNAEHNAHAVRFTAGHNYNLNSRQTVYNWFNTHLRLGHNAPVKEQPFDPIPPQQLSVFDQHHPRPTNSTDAPTLKHHLINLAKQQIQKLIPDDPPSLARYRQVIAPALQHMLATQLPPADQVSAQLISQVSKPAYRVQKLLLSRQHHPERIPALAFIPERATGPATLVILPQGKAALLMPDEAPSPLLTSLLHKGHLVLAIDPLLIGELAAPDNPTTNPKHEFFAGYNRTILANRAHDILTAIAYLRGLDHVRHVNLIGLGKAGPWCLLARALAGDAVARTAADADRFDFNAVQSLADENYLPASLRYGGLWPLVALAAPADLFVYNTPRAERPHWLLKTYAAAGALGQLRIEPTASTADLVEWIGNAR